MEFKISYTFLSVYKRCKKRAYLQLVKKVVPRDKIDHRSFIVGIVADWLFRKWVEDRNYEEEWMLNKAEDIFNWFTTKRHIRYRDSQDKGKLLRKLQASVQHLQDAAFAEQLPNRKIETQKKIEKTVNGVVYTGKLDIWFPDEKAIWDLKITTAKRYLDDFQLHFFAWLMKECGFEIEQLAFLSPLMKPYLQPAPYSLTIMQDFEEELFLLVELIKEGYWEADATDCWGCPVQKWCEGDLEVTSCRKNIKGGFTLDL